MRSIYIAVKESSGIYIYIYIYKGEREREWMGNVKTQKGR
jgi:hypothetical protein